jgi:hypothetical protein
MNTYLVKKRNVVSRMENFKIATEIKFESDLVTQLRKLLF